MRKRWFANVHVKTLIEIELNFFRKVRWDCVMHIFFDRAFLFYAIVTIERYVDTNRNHFITSHVSREHSIIDFDIVLFTFKTSLSSFFFHLWSRKETLFFIETSLRESSRRAFHLNFFLLKTFNHDINSRLTT